MKKEPIVILGFGRSGTTWVSDIVSKMLGGLILFEPMHPEVCKDSKLLCYHNGTDNNLNTKTFDIIQKNLGGEIKNKWLLRNHLSSDLEKVNDVFVNNVWDNCRIIGYKSIRQNFLIPWIYNNISTKIVFLKRDILSVIASIIRRERFWEEYGFEFHEEKFLKEVLISLKYTFLDNRGLLQLYKTLDDKYLKVAFLWVVTHVVVEYDLNKFDLPLFEYSNFYTNPYKSSKKLATYLGFEDIELHPSYLFTPSMLTLRTFHKNPQNKKYNEDGFKVFWEDTLNKSQVQKILTLEKEINSFIIKNNC